MAGRVNFRKIRLDDPDASRLQDHVKDLVNSINANPFFNGAFHVVDIVSSDNFKIYTGFGRAVRGWIITDRVFNSGVNPNGNMHRIIDPDNSSGVLTLNCPSNFGLYTFWVF